MSELRYWGRRVLFHIVDSRPAWAIVRLGRWIDQTYLRFSGIDEIFESTGPPAIPGETNKQYLARLREHCLRS
jgi:hypothetical protein